MATLFGFVAQDILNNVNFAPTANKALYEITKDKALKPQPQPKLLIPTSFVQTFQEPDPHSKSLNDCLKHCSKLSFSLTQCKKQCNKKYKQPTEQEINKEAAQATKQAMNETRKHFWWYPFQNEFITNN